MGLRVNKGRKLTQDLTAAHLDSSDLSDHVRLRAARCLQVNDAERHLGQMGPKIIKGGLQRHDGDTRDASDTDERLADA